MDGLPNTLYPVQSLDSDPFLELSIQYSSFDGYRSVLYVMPFWLAEDVDSQMRDVILSHADTFSRQVDARFVRKLRLRLGNGFRIMSAI